MAAGDPRNDSLFIDVPKAAARFGLSASAFRERYIYSGRIRLVFGRPRQRRKRQILLRADLERLKRES